MKASISVILLAIFFVFIFYVELDQDLSTLLNERFKNAINRATHDASLCINEEQYSEGRIVFDPNAALLTFRKTLALNLGLSPDNLEPKPQTIFDSRPNIEVLDFIDDSDGVIFPFLYENPAYGISKILYGPSVIAVVKINKPVFCTLSAKFDFRKWSVYEYPIPR